MEEITELLKTKERFADAVRKLADLNALVVQAQQEVNQLNININKLEEK